MRRRCRWSYSRAHSRSRRERSRPSWSDSKRLSRTNMVVDELVERARSGDAGALDDLVSAVRDRIYGLALRMLWHPEDAADATQEILIRIVTHLSEFRGESRFTSWCYAIAANHLRTVRRSRAEAAEYTFASFEEELRTI